MGDTAFVSVPVPCTHGETESSVVTRWVKVEAKVNSTPADDHRAQMSVIYACACCGGSARGDLCTRCTP